MGRANFGFTDGYNLGFQVPGFALRFEEQIGIPRTPYLKPYYLIPCTLKPPQQP
jgi:hypothetical protein